MFKKNPKLNHIKNARMTVKSLYLYIYTYNLVAFEKSCIADRYNYLKNRFTADNPIIKVTGYLSVCTDGNANR